MEYIEQKTNKQMNYLSLKKYNLYSESLGSLLYFVVKTEADVPVMSGKNPSGIKGEPIGKSYTATQVRYFLILFCSLISLFSSFVWASAFIYNYSIETKTKYQEHYPQLEEIWKKANKSELPKTKK